MLSPFVRTRDSSSVPLALTISPTTIRVVYDVNAVNDWNIPSGDVVDDNVGNLNRVETVIDQQDIASTILRKHRPART